MGDQNEIMVERQGPVTLFDIKGDVTINSDPHFKESYNNLDIADTNKILLKFYEDSYINSGGIAVLIQLLAQTKTNNQQIGITGLSDHFKKIFNMVGITKFAKIYDTAEQAIESLSGS